jgi:ATP-dependent protease HslVU (ClpYQ) peptidase subunit
MTCIAGAIKDGEVWIGGDAVSISREACVRVGVKSKVFTLGEFLIGSSGTVRTGQIAQFLFDVPKVDGDLTAYLVKSFAPALRAAMKENGGEIKVQSGADEMDGRLLIGVRGRLFTIDSGYGVFESRANYAAVGCADQEALAAMFTVNSLLAGDATGEQIVKHGLLAAAEFDSNIRPPFTILKL